VRRPARCATWDENGEDDVTPVSLRHAGGCGGSFHRSVQCGDPITPTLGGYTELWNAFKRITAGASLAEKTALCGGTAARVYRLTVP
jgi:hypothetical protein